MEFANIDRQARLWDNTRKSDSHSDHPSRLALRMAKPYGVLSPKGEGGPFMHYVYLIKSLSHPEQKYVGITEDLKKRIAEHNSGQSTHTAKFMP